MGKKRSLKSILLSVILIIVLIPMVLVTILSIASNRKQSQENYETNGMLLMEIADNIIDTEMVQYAKTLNTLISNEDFENLESLKSTITLLDENDDTVINLYFAREADGEYIQSSNAALPEGYNAKSRLWYIDSSANQNNIRIQSPYVDVTTGENVITISKAVKKDNNFIGVIAVDIELNSLSDALSVLRYGNTGELIITSEDGFVISNSDKSKIATQEPTEYEVWNDITNNNEGEIKFSYNGTKYEGYYMTSEKSGWKIILKTEAGELRSGELGNIKTTSIILIIIVIMITIIVTGMTKGVISSVDILAKRIDEASKGDFSEYINVDSKTREFSLLRDSFNAMKDNLTSLIRRVNDSVIDMDDTVSNSLKMSEEILASIEQVTTTMGEISIGTNKSSSELEEISVNMDNLSTSIDAINADTNNVNNVAIQTNKLGSQGIKVADLVLNKSNQTKESTEEVSRVVEQVSNSIGKIQDINTTISAITEQTNLLALNAAIEAARAGEAGKGFAVVSEEIRKLAEQTSISAGEINLIIKEINDTAKIAVNRVADTSKVVDEQESAVLESQKIFSEIVSSVESLGNKLANITNGVSEINGMKNNVVERVEGLSALLQETAAGSEEVNASAEEINETTEKFVQDFNELKNKSQELKDETSKFKF